MFSKLTFLVVDDSSSVRKLMRLSLEKLNATVIDAEDGQIALSLARNSKFDVVITDINMPNIDGFGLIKGLRMIPHHQKTPVICVTTESSQDKKMLGKSSGADAWLVKPFAPESLVDVTKKVIVKK